MYIYIYIYLLPLFCFGGFCWLFCPLRVEYKFWQIQGIAIKTFHWIRYWNWAQNISRSLYSSTLFIIWCVWESFRKLKQKKPFIFAGDDKSLNFSSLTAWKSLASSYQSHIKLMATQRVKWYDFSPNSTFFILCNLYQPLCCEPIQSATKDQTFSEKCQSYLLKFPNNWANYIYCNVTVNVTHVSLQLCSHCTPHNCKSIFYGWEQYNEIFYAYTSPTQ